MDRTFHKTALRMMSCFWIVALVISLLPHGAAAKQVPAGTFIRNVAQTTYFNEALGIIETVYSNAVDAKVAAVPALDVNGYSELMLTRGAMAQYYFEVANIGNVPLNAAMTMQHQEGAAMMNDARLVYDANANGRIDNGGELLHFLHIDHFGHSHAGDHLVRIDSNRITSTLAIKQFQI